MTFSGAGFATARLSPEVRLGGTAAESTVWESDTEGYCRPPRALRGTLRLSLTVGGQRASVTEALSFDAGAIRSVSLSNAPVPTDIAAAVSISVHGSGFGRVPSSQALPNPSLTYKPSTLKPKP